MIGTNMKELFEYLRTNREIEFPYNNHTYTIEPGGSTKNILFSIWKAISEYASADCICEYAGIPGSPLTDEVLMDFLNTKCFDGKSFMDIEKDVTVDIIF